MLIFFDLACRFPGRTWSPNTWKVRYALNYKKIPYRTDWVEFADIESLSKLRGIPPSKLERDGTPQYTLPVIFNPAHDRYVSDSATIMKYLDKAYPESPKAFPPGTRALQTAFLSAFVPKTSPIWPVILPAVAGKFGPTSMEAFKEKREAQFGKTIEEMARDISTREINWAKFKKGMSDIDRWMKSNEDDVGGPFMMGEKPVFVDFVIGALLAWIRNVWGEESTEWTEMKTWDDHRWAKHADALKPYESADDGLKPCHANDSSNLLGSDTASDAKKLLL